MTHHAVRCMRQFHIVGDRVSILDMDTRGVVVSLYSGSVDDFRADCPFVPPEEWSLLPGTVERLYQPGDRHFTRGVDKQERTYPLPWPPGDIILERLNEIVDAGDVRRGGDAVQAVEF